MTNHEWTDDELKNLMGYAAAHGTETNPYYIVSVDGVVRHN